MSELKSHEFRDVTVNITMAEYEELFNAKQQLEKYKNLLLCIEMKNDIFNKLKSKLNKEDDDIKDYIKYFNWFDKYYDELK